MITKSQLLKKMACLGRLCLTHPNCELHLSSYSPGDGKRRWQIQAIDSDHKEIASWPRYGHWPTQQFDAYLDRLVDALWMVEERTQPQNPLRS